MTTMNKQATAQYLSGLVPAYSFMGAKFMDGEARHYAELNKSVAGALRESTLPDTAEFGVSEGGRVTLRYAGKELPLFCVFEDTFRGRPWDCKKYCNQEYLMFSSALRVCEALMADAA